MPLPHQIALFNKRVTNRFIEPLVGKLPGFARVHHAGRATNTTYITPLLAFRHEDVYLVALTYGPSVDWLKNVQRGPASFETRDGGGRPIVVIEVIAFESVRDAFPLPVRLVLRLLRVDSVAQITTSVAVVS